MRAAHANIPGLNDMHFNAIAENLKSSLEELKISNDLIGQVLALVGTLHDDVLNRPTKEK